MWQQISLKGMVDRQFFCKTLEYFPINVPATIEVKLMLQDTICLATFLAMTLQEKLEVDGSV